MRAWIRDQPLWVRMGLPLALVILASSLWMWDRQQGPILAIQQRQAEAEIDRLATQLSATYGPELGRGGFGLGPGVARDARLLDVAIEVRSAGRVWSEGSTDRAVRAPLAEAVRPISGPGGEPLGELRVARRLTEQLGRFRESRREGLAMAILSALVGTMAVLWLTARVSVRLHQLNRGSERFAAGDLRHRLPRPAGRELGHMADRLNIMAEQLHERLGELRAQRNEQEAILRSMEGGVVAVDAEQRILRMNPIARRMLGVPGLETRGTPLGRIVTDGSILRFAADSIADPARRTAEFSLYTDRQILLRVTSSPLLDAEDEPVGTIMLLSDVTQLRRLESMRTDFAANVSHELRTPITNIKGYAETLLDAGSAGEEMPLSFLRVIARNADRLGAIVDDMLALTNLERTDGQTLPTSPTSVASVVDTVRAQMGREARERGIALETTAPDGLRLLVNQRLIEQALLNLVANAVKYSPEGTTVRVSAAPATLDDDRPAVQLIVVDEGVGISKEHLPRIFERFYRADKARSREQGGTGLGLSIVKHIALVHGGTVSVDSEPGVGSTFRLVLPAAGGATGGGNARGVAAGTRPRDPGRGSDQRLIGGSAPA